MDDFSAAVIIVAAAAIGFFGTMLVWEIIEAVF